MLILFLGNNVARGLADWLSLHGEKVVYQKERIDLNYIKTVGPDFIISYNYHYIVPFEIIELFNKRIINLHISLLPWNKGTYPNIWSFLEDTPKGVSIIYLEKDVDCGAIIAQKEIFFDEKREALNTSYEKLHIEIQDLFKANWPRIKVGGINSKKQQGKGSMYFDRDFYEIEHLLGKKGWDMSIIELKKKYESWKQEKKNI